MSITGRNPGPVVWMTACMHGDEVAGLVIIQEIFRTIRRCLLRGTVHAFPLMNPIGFETISRNITFSREDLNRSFPGNANGSLGERIACQIFSRIMDTSPGLLLDLHSDWRQSIPYVLLDRKSGEISGSVYEFSRQICQKSGFCIIEDNDEIWSSLTHNLLLRDIPAVTFELGESYVVNEKIIDYGVSSIMTILADFKMVEPALQGFRYPMHQDYKTGQILRYSDQPCCTKSGIIRFLVKPGDLVETGQAVAKVYNAFGKLQETVTAVSKSIVLGNADSSVVFPGMPVMAFGVF